jgi:LAO/AO transport system ATPase
VLTDLFQRFRDGDRLALSRLLSVVARGQDLEEVRAALGTVQAPSRVVAITGSGGVGKSTLVGKSIEWLRNHHHKVAILACDPQSPLSGGALLGDRFRMPARPDDDGVFIRSLAAASGQGAVARHLDLMIRLLEAFGFDIVVLETVGAGQGDTAVRELADAVVLLLQPETGDDLQWEKAGVLEVADVVVVHKADLPGAEHIEAQVRAALNLSEGRAVPVLRVSARTGEGIDRLWKAILESSLRRGTDRARGQNLLRLTQEILAARYCEAEAERDPRLQQLIAQWQEGHEPPSEAAWKLIDLLQPEASDHRG